MLQLQQLDLVDGRVLVERQLLDAGLDAGLEYVGSVLQQLHTRSQLLALVRLLHTQLARLTVPARACHASIGTG